MPVFNNALAGAAGSGGAAYEISRSLRFNSGDSAYLSRTPSVEGSRTTWTWSGWVKRSKLGAQQPLFNAGVTGGQQISGISFFNNDKLEVWTGVQAVSTEAWCQTNAVFRDPSAWYHIVVAVDTTQSTAANRVKIYVNGSLQDVAGYASYNAYPSPNYSYAFNSAVAHQIGRDTVGTPAYGNGYLADVHFVDGQQLTADDFGEPDEDTGVWNPKEYTHADPVSSTAITNVNTLNNSGTQTVTAAGWQTLNNALDGSTSNKAPSNNNTAGTITFGAQLYAVTKVRAYTRFYGGGTARLYYNGSIVHQTGTINNNSATGWYTIYSGPAITIDQYWQQMSNGASDDFWALEINNTIVTASGNGNNMTSSISGSVIELTTTDNSNYSSFTAGTAVNSVAKVVSTNSSTPSITVDAGSWSTGNTVTTSSNSFYLDFSDNSSNDALGYDAAGSNNWTVNYLEAGNSGTTVSAATGALPILNTSGDYGGTATSGVRSDSDSSNIVLALPLNGANNGTTITDYHHTIKGSGSAKAITLFSGSTSGGAVTDTSQSQYYGSSFYVVRGGVNANESDYITRTGDTDLNFGTGDFTVEFWYRPTTLDSNQVIFDNRHPTTGWPNSSNGYSLVCNSSGTIIFYTGGNNRITASSVLSVGTWSHITVDRDSGTTTIRVNGVNKGSWSDTNNYNEGRFTLGSSSPNGEGANGHFADLRIYKGVAKYTSNFTVPSKPDFSNSDSLIDTPTNYDDGTNVGGNYATWNALTGNTTLSNGNLDSTGKSGHNQCLSTIGMSSGKYYCEITVTDDTGYTGIGIATKAEDGSFLGNTSNGYLYYSSNGNKRTSGTNASYGNSYTTGDTIGIAFDADGGNLYFYKNGAIQNSGTAAFTGLTSGPYFFAVDQYNTSNVITGNFGQRAFAISSVPTGYKSLCTQNLDDPTIADGSDYFDIKLWEGTGVAKSITGYSFSPDFVWGKARSATNTHWLMDTVRGAGNRLVSADDRAEDTPSGVLTSFNSDGFSIGTNTESNNSNGTTYVGWAWDAPTSFSNSAGSNGATIASSGKVNHTSGFSIATYTGATGNQKFRHGLNAKPALIFIKNRDSAANWFVMVDIGTTYYKYGHLNTTAAFADATTQPVSSTTVTLGNNNAWFGANGDNYVAYCFAPVEGYSAFGSYTGNGSDDGPFVYTGFRPAFILTTAYSSNSNNNNNWNIHDTSRDPFNEASEILAPNSSGAALDNSHTGIDILSNGFKLKADTNGQSNYSGWDYIYAAFAENPFKYARAR